MFTPTWRKHIISVLNIAPLLANKTNIRKYIRNKKKWLRPIFWKGCENSVMPVMLHQCDYYSHPYSFITSSFTKFVRGSIANFNSLLFIHNIRFAVPAVSVILSKQAGRFKSKPQSKFSTSSSFSRSFISFDCKYKFMLFKWLNSLTAPGCTHIR